MGKERRQDAFWSHQNINSNEMRTWIYDIRIKGGPEFESIKENMIKICDEEDEEAIKSKNTIKSFKRAVVKVKL